MWDGEESVMNDFQMSILAMKVQQAQKKPCMLCGKKPDGAGVFFPSVEFGPKVGQPKGKTRACVYSLCSKCKSKSDWEEKVEQALIKSYLASKGNNQN